MGKAMEELRKKFIVEEKLDEKMITEYIERSLRFGKVSIDGGVIIEKEGMATKDQIGLAVVMRFLANRLEKGISAEVNTKELSQNLGIPEDQVAARLADLRDEGVVIRVDKGVYRVNPTRIGRFLDYLEDKYLKGTK
ncbi:MAG: hypothetical protein QW510_06600 [Candidatus Bathyarchaeia archaeon]